ncbi:hypothetical protein E1B28_009738 [Marasmius oreades]|uniref:Ribosomal protein/NADH dehydrogenase domain-containing protein n=1 Tax=Marasmius oreades TaxID=181124 RepID=A0A9P7RWT5_9AGAR|nr:uncharacterized protein E1B28_009738 [Marasmius oreades]KAG7090636.1 hypothetical protein E1B28_009738 [Marasmius oreades]
MAFGSLEVVFAAEGSPKTGIYRGKLSTTRRVLFAFITVMVRKLKVTIGPSRLSKILEHLHSSPRLSLFGLRAIRLSYAFRNDHFGARHFVKEDLPRIRHANPSLKIEVEKVLKTAQEQWRPEMELQLEDGTLKTIDMHKKWSTNILKELMEVAGGDPWRKWKNKAQREGHPLVQGEEIERPTPLPPTGMLPLPNLKVYRETHPPESKEKKVEKKKDPSKRISLDASKKKEAPTSQADLSNLTTKTGAAAVLP